MSFLRRYYPLILILLVGFLVRIYILQLSKDFIWDEMFSFVYSQKPWLQSVHFWLLETNPPLHLLLLKLWWLIFPAYELSARFLSVVIGIAALGAMWSAAQKICVKTFWSAALILALTPQVIFYSTLARGYSVLILFATLSLNYFLTVITTPDAHAIPLRKLAVINPLLLFTHLTGIILVIVEAIFICTQSTEKRVAWFRSQLTLVFPLLWILVSFISKRPLAGTLGGAWFFNMSSLSLWEKWSPFRLLLFGPGSDLRSIGILAVCALLTCLTLALQIRRRAVTPQFQFLLLTILFNIGVIVATQTWNIKFLVVSIPAFTLLLSYTFDTVLKNAYIIIAVVLTLTVPSIATLASVLPLSDWTDLNAYLYFNTNVSIKQAFIDTNFTDGLMLDRYYQAPMPALVYSTPAVEHNKEDAYVTMNYILYHHTEQEILAWYTAQYLDTYTELYVLDTPLYQVDLKQILQSKGWHLKKQLPHIGPAKDQIQTLYVFTKS